MKALYSFLQYNFLSQKFQKSFMQKIFFIRYHKLQKQFQNHLFQAIKIVYIFIDYSLALNFLKIIINFNLC